MTLLDTTFLIDLMRGRPPALAKKVELQAEGRSLWVPSVVLYELHRGLAGSAAPAKEQARVADVLASLPVLPFDEVAATHAGRIDGELRRRGEPIEPEDAMIAGSAIARGESLVTRNPRHFGRVPGMRLESY